MAPETELFIKGLKWPKKTVRCRYLWSEYSRKLSSSKLASLSSLLGIHLQGWGIPVWFREGRVKFLHVRFVETGRPPSAFPSSTEGTLNGDFKVFSSDMGAGCVHLIACKLTPAEQALVRRLSRWAHGYVV